MAVSAALGSPTLEVADFGPIREATVDLRPLTVFVGPSNTGKSYLAILIYALHRALRATDYPNGPFSNTGLNGPYSQSRKEYSEEFSNSLSGFVDVLAGAGDPANGDEIAMPADVAKEVSVILDEHADVIAGEVKRCFGLKEVTSLIRQGRSDAARVRIKVRQAQASSALKHDLVLGSECTFRADIPADTPMPLMQGLGSSTIYRSVDEFMRFGGVPPEKNRSRLGFVWHKIRRPVMGPLFDPAYYLPAGRNGLMHAQKVVMSALVASASTAGLREPWRSPTLSGVLADFLDELLYIDRPTVGSANSRGYNGRAIEESVLKGRIERERSVTFGYPHFAFVPDGWESSLPLANASSMVSELAPLVLLLSNRVTYGNLLIIEEPESHLHPAMQVELMRQLGVLVNSGLRILVNTHSEWVLDELANMVRRSAVTGDPLVNGQTALSPEQVGAWLFEPQSQPDGSVVSEICLDDSGLYPSKFDEVAIALHNDWAQITDRIEAGAP